MELIIYNKSGVQIASARTFTYSAEAMGEKNISLTVESPVKIAFTPFCYVTFKNENYYLQSEATGKRKSASGGRGDALEYNLTFKSKQTDLVNCDFLDYLLDGGQFYSGMGEFTFYGDVYDLARRIQASLNKEYTGGSAWTIKMPKTGYSDPQDISTIGISERSLDSEQKQITVSDENCWNALTRAYSDYGFNFYLDTTSRIIYIGVAYPQLSVGGSTVVFEYGSGKGLYEINREVDAEGLITRLRAYGSEKNLPIDYMALGQRVVTRLQLPSYRTTQTETHPTDYVLASSALIDYYGIKPGKQTFDDIFPTIEGILDGNSHPIDTIHAVETIVDGKDSDGNLTQSSFFVYLYDLGFDINDYLTSDAATMSMKTGYCGGAEFEIVQAIPVVSGETYYSEGVRWKFKLNKNTSYSQNYVLPSGSVLIATDDTFSLLNISMPETYVLAAEARLLTSAEEYLAENSRSKISYSVALDEIYFANNPLVAAALKEGVSVKIIDNDLGDTTDDGGLTYYTVKSIQSLTIKHSSEKLLPTYNITLSESLVAGLIDRIQNEISNNSEHIDINTVQNSRDRRNAIKSTRELRQLKDLTFDADGYFEVDRIKPLSIETKYLSVGAKSSNFSTVGVSVKSYNDGAYKVSLTSGYINHRDLWWGTLAEREGVPPVAGSVKWVWTLSGALSYTMSDDTKPYYIYIRANLTSGVADWLVTTEQKAYIDATYYYFQLGVIYVPLSGQRGLALVNGMAFFSGGQIYGDNIQSINYTEDGTNTGSKYGLNDGIIRIGNTTKGMTYDAINGLILYGAGVSEINIADKILIDGVQISSVNLSDYASLARKDGTLQTNLYATKSDILATSRNFSIAGSTGLTAAAVGFNGSGNVALSLAGTLAVASGGTGKNSVAANSMLYASVNNAYSEVATSEFGRGLLSAESGVLQSGLNADFLDNYHETSFFRALRSVIVGGVETETSLATGSYRVAESGHSTLLVNFSGVGISTPVLQVYAHYSDELYFRTGRDSETNFDGIERYHNRIWHSGNSNLTTVPWSASSVNVADTYYINGLQISSYNLSDSGNIARLNSQNEFTQVQRITKTAGVSSNEYHLELYSAPGDASGEVSIRFHQSNRWWKQLRANANGFYFTNGSTNDAVAIYAGWVDAEAGYSIDSVAIIDPSRNIVNAASITQQSGTIGTSNFISQTTGWRGDYAGNWDVRSLYTDELRAKAFTADITQALAGSEQLTKSVSKLAANYTIPAQGSASRMIIDDLEGFPGIRCFQDGDWIRHRVFNRSGGGLTIADVWGTVVLDTTYGTGGFETNNTQAYIFTCLDVGGVAGLQVYRGAMVLDYGTSGSGVIESTVLDAQGSPYTQTKSWINNPSVNTNYTIHTRTGNLSGIQNCSGYGFYGQNTFLTGKLLAGDLSKVGQYIEYESGVMTIKAVVNVIGGNAATTTDVSTAQSTAISTAASDATSKVNDLKNISLVDRGNLSWSTDWNTVTQTGMYAVEFGGEIYPANYPIGAYPYGNLKVEKSVGAITQTYTTHYDSQVYSRSSWWGDSWQPWRQIEDVSGSQSKATAAETAANTYSSGLVTTLSNSLGSLAYDDLVGLAKLDNTIIEGGLIKTTLLDAPYIQSSIINTTYINGLSLNFTQGLIGNWNISTNRLYSSISTPNGSAINFSNVSGDTGGAYYNGSNWLQGLTFSWHQSNNAGHIVLGNIAENSSSKKVGYYGIQMMSHEGVEFFALAGNSNVSTADDSRYYNRLAGWAFNASKLYSTNLTGTSDGSAYTTTGMVIGSGGFIATPNYLVTTAGILYAQNAVISGAITATSGTFTGTVHAGAGNIGAFTINTHLYTGSKTAYNDGLAGVHVGSDGIGLGSAFSVSAAGAAILANATVTGTVNANAGTFNNVSFLSGTMAGFTVNSTEGLYSGSGVTRVQMKAGAGFWAGDDTFAAAQFSVSPAGAIKALSGAIGGLTIMNDGLYGNTSGGVIQLQSADSQRFVGIGVPNAISTSTGINTISYFKYYGSSSGDIYAGYFTAQNSGSGRSVAIKASFGDLIVEDGVIEGNVIIATSDIHNMANSTGTMPSGYHLYSNRNFTDNRTKTLPDPNEYKEGECIKIINWQGWDITLVPAAGNYINGFLQSTGTNIRIFDIGANVTLRATKYASGTYNDCWMIVDFGGTSIGIN